MTATRSVVEDRPGDNQLHLWGDVASIRFTVNSTDEQMNEENLEGFEEEDRIYLYVFYALGRRPIGLIDPEYDYWARRFRPPNSEIRRRGENLKRDIQLNTIRYLGEGFESRISEVERGSIVTLGLLITAVGGGVGGASYGVYKAIRDYPDFCKGLNMLRDHTQSLIDTFWVTWLRLIDHYLLRAA